MATSTSVTRRQANRVLLFIYTMITSELWFVWMTVALLRSSHYKVNSELLWKPLADIENAAILYLAV